MKNSIVILSILTTAFSCDNPVELKTYSISGYIGLHQQVQTIEPFVIRLYQNDLLLATSNSPEFEFSALKEGENYTLVPESNAPSFNGITALDYVMLNKYVDGTETPSPFQFIAADMNKDGIVDSTDADLLWACLADGTGCNGVRFVTPDYTPEGQGHADQITIDHLNSDQQVQLYGIKIGDISTVPH